MDSTPPSAHNESVANGCFFLVRVMHMPSSCLLTSPPSPSLTLPSLSLSPAPPRPKNEGEEKAILRARSQSLFLRAWRQAWVGGCSQPSLPHTPDFGSLAPGSVRCGRGAEPRASSLEDGSPCVSEEKPSVQFTVVPSAGMSADGGDHHVRNAAAKSAKAGGGSANQIEGAFFRGGSSFFRAVNFELFARGNDPIQRAIAVAGSIAFLASLYTIASMDRGSSASGRGASRRGDDT